MNSCKYILSFALTVLAISANCQVQNFTLMNVSDGKMVSLEGYQSCVGLVAIFTSNECAYDSYYTARLKVLTESFAGKIQFLLINSHLDPEETVEKMKAKYSFWGMNVPYLADKEQVAMECLGAKKSPEVFLLKNEGGKYTTVYSGAIDDNAQVSAAVSEKYLRNSINKLLKGEAIDVPVTRAVGCSIRKK